MYSRIDHQLKFMAEYPPLLLDYNPENRVFTIGEDTIGLAEYAQYSPDRPEQITEEQARELIRSSKLGLTVLGNLVQMPPMYEWLKSMDPEAMNRAREVVADTMIDAYRELESGKSLNLLKGSHWGFGMGLIRAGHPTFNVLGDCACLGVNLYGNMFSQSDFKDGFAEYGFHNIDNQTQRTALVAGAGALAYLCDIEST